MRSRRAWSRRACMRCRSPRAWPTRASRTLTCLRVASTAAGPSASRALAVSIRDCACWAFCRLPAPAGEGLVAALLVTGEDQLGLLGADLGPRLFDQRLLALQVGLGIGEVGLGTEHVGFGGGQGGAEVAVVEAGEQLAGLDRLVVLDQNVLDEAGDFRRDQGEIGVHIGVVGALHDPWGEQVGTGRPAGSGPAGRRAAGCPCAK